MCADHTLCMACMACSHHPNHTFDTVTTPCRWHVDRQRGRRGREKRGWQLTHSLQHPAGTHNPSSLLLPSFPLLISLPHPPHTLTPSPPLIWLTITSTSLHLSLNPPLLSHTRIPNLPQCMCQCTEETQQQQQAPLLAFLTTSSSCPPPPACYKCTHKQQVVHV